jgi:glycolate oxidase FAD binding subunit
MSTGGSFRLPTSPASDLPAADQAGELADRIAQAAAATRPLRIVGGGTRAAYGRPVTGEPLEVAGHRGVVAYDPSELVITARAGTPVAEIERALAAQGQMLAFEPPAFGQGGTVGGMVATGLSGPRRPFSGALRDHVLGAKILDGRGRTLSFGGTVFKNVAGFDAFRLMAGSLGCLGVILEVSLRVFPRPRAEAALAFELPGESARLRTVELMRRPLPLSGAFHDGERLHLRLSGGEAAVRAAQAELGGEAEDLSLWTAVRDLAHPRLRAPVLWRISTPPTARLPFPTLWDWGGAQHWLPAQEVDPAVWGAAQAVGGHAALVRGGSDRIFQPLPEALFALHRRIKAGLDPAGVLNPGRMYEGL